MSEEKKYTQEEVAILVSGEVAKQRLAGLESHLKTIEVNNNMSNSKLEANVNAIRSLIVDHNKNLDVYKDNIRQEMKDNYVSTEIFKLEQIRVDTSIKNMTTAFNAKVDGLWKRISLPVGAAVIVIQIFFWLFEKKVFFK